VEHPDAVFPYRARRLPPKRSPVFAAGLVMILGAAGLLLLLFAGIVLGYAYYQAGQRIVPGVNAGGMPVGGMTIPEAAAELHRAWNVERRITVADGLQTWQVSPADLGLSLNPGETAASAYSIGHNQGLPAEVSQMAVSLAEGWEIQPVIQYDEAAARAGLEALAAQGSKPPRDATIAIQNGQAVPVPGELGYSINIEETLDRIAANPQDVVQSGLLKASLKPVPPRINDVGPALAEAQRLLQTPAGFRAYDPITDETLDFTIPPEVIGTWLTVQPGDQGPQVGMEEAQAIEYLRALSDTIGPERKIDAETYGPPLAQAVRQGAVATITLNHNPTMYTVQPGDTLLKIGWNVGVPFWMILEANPGLDPEALWAGEQITIPSKDRLLPLPVVPNKRIVISISEQRLWAYQDGAQVAKHVISTGIDRSPTQPGVFQVQTHDPNAYASVWDLNMPNFLGIYEAWPGFMNGIHGLPTLSNGRRLWANILGRPASYGCIILDLDAAEWLYNWAEEGVVVAIEA
jgi:lipoprotein-anchoring transpeptidase ErfK/SrfK